MLLKRCKKSATLAYERALETFRQLEERGADREEGERRIRGDAEE